MNKTAKILQFKKSSVVSENTNEWLVSNYKQIDDLKFKFDNALAIREIGKIVEGKPYTIEDVWQDVLENELLYKETQQ